MGHFCVVSLPFILKNGPPTYQQNINMAFKEHFGVLVKLFLDYFSVFNYLKTHMAKTLIMLQQMLTIQY